MRIVRRDFYDVSRSDYFDLYPIGDCHVGAAACDEDYLRRLVDCIAADDRAWWVGIGDYCLPFEAELLTRRGFVKAGDLRIGEDVLAFDGQVTRWTPLRGVYVTPDAPLLSLRSKSFAMTCTPNHGWICDDRHKERWTGKRRKRRIEGLRKVATADLKAQHRIITAAPCADGGDLPITPDEAALLGWIITDGFITVRNENSFIAGVSQAKEPYRQQIRERFADWFTAEYVEEKPGVLPRSTFNVKVGRLRELFARIGERAETVEQNLPGIVGRLSVDARHAMLQAMLEAEGWNDGGQWFSQQPGPAMDAFCVLATLEGYRLSLGKVNAAGVRQVKLMTNRPRVTVADLKIEQAGRGAAWCPNTDLGTCVVRLGRQITITGNCDFINRSDPRFSFDSLAPWITARMMTDLAGAQRERFLSIVKPIASKCLAMAEGNHETSILKYYERDIYSEIVTGVREAAGHPDTYKLALGYTGWLRLAFHRSDATTKQRITTFDIKVHHGYGGGRTPGPKTNRLQDMLLDNEADIVLFGHVHGVTLHSVWVEYLDQGNKVQQRQRVGVITGTCLRSGNPAPDTGATYSERAGYRPQGAWGQVVRLRPGEEDVRRRIRVSTLDV